jgi:prophage antirepressor-like protein
MNDVVFFYHNDLDAEYSMEIVDSDGEKWVLASSVGFALGIQSIRKLIKDLKASEGLIEGRHFCNIKLQYSEKDVRPGNPDRLLLSYRGVIRVAMRSDGPRAVAFRDWAEEVLYNAMVRSQAAPKPSLCKLPLIPGEDVSGRYKKAAAIVKSILEAGKALKASETVRMRMAVDAAYKETGVQFSELVRTDVEPGSIEGFISETCVIGRGRTISPNSLYCSYLDFCDDIGQAPISRNKFYQEVQIIEPSVKRAQTGPDRNRVFSGISLAVKEVA